MSFEKVNRPEGVCVGYSGGRVNCLAEEKHEGAAMSVVASLVREDGFEVIHMARDEFDQLDIELRIPDGETMLRAFAIFTSRVDGIAATFEPETDEEREARTEHVREAKVSTGNPAGR